MTDLASPAGGPTPEESQCGPVPDPISFSLAGLPPGMDAELRRLEYNYALDMEDRRLAEKSLELEDQRATRGQWMAFTLALLFLGVLVTSVLTGAHLVAAGLMGSGIAVGVGSFIYSHRQQQVTTLPKFASRERAPLTDPAPEAA